MTGVIELPPFRVRSAAAQVADHLRHECRRAENGYALLPGERELAERLQVSRVTVRAALAQLQDEGLVRRVPGSGTQVVPKEVQH